jgi:hypothetical protein
VPCGWLALSSDRTHWFATCCPLLFLLVIASRMYVHSSIGVQPASGNVGIAFAMVIGAGLCTTLGACAAFWAKLASERTLAIGLALSAGVMLCVLSKPSAVISCQTCASFSDGATRTTSGRHTHAPPHNEYTLASSDRSPCP